MRAVPFIGATALIAALFAAPAEAAPAAALAAPDIPVASVKAHLAQFQSIATANGPSRMTGTRANFWSISVR